MPNIFPLNAVERHFKQVLQYAPGMLGNDAVIFFWIGLKRRLSAELMKELITLYNKNIMPYYYYK